MPDEKLDLDDVRRKLEAERDSLTEEMENPAIYPTTEGLPGNPDRSDLARTYDQYQRQSAIEERMQHRLDLVDAALERLDEGTYGKCVNCGKQIDPERLRAIPEAPMCMDCESKLTRS